MRFSLLNRGNGFALDDNGLLDHATRQKLIQVVTGRLGVEVSFSGKKFTLEEVIGKQAKKIRHHLTGTQQYRPYLSRW
ncbi:MAG: hypothetical protein BA861_03315 [Desulfobacterales bacterium S3730MH5]|nr:MAG: hypothetical protein BA861_03315 [Desulfobacterales bacterium S3730MH5]OEU83005.1 MAG: hypothetical protein BA873_00915 [Desulfobulbaceae bacterium C00003063]OEU83974.1 MAG: hypothetical protein BA865_03545 [Desulfobacterales bacterium S5133MH4]